MKSSKYIDIASINNVIGNIYSNLNLLSESDKYTFNKEDFPNSFHKITFSALYNLFQLGAKNITFELLQDYFNQRPKEKMERGSIPDDANCCPYAFSRWSIVSLC